MTIEEGRQAALSDTTPNAVTPYSIAIACVVKRGKHPWRTCSNTVGITAQRLRGYHVGRRSVRATNPGRRVPANAARPRYAPSGISASTRSASCRSDSCQPR